MYDLQNRVGQLRELYNLTNPTCNSCIQYHNCDQYYRDLVMHGNVANYAQDTPRTGQAFTYYNPPENCSNVCSPQDDS